MKQLIYRSRPFGFDRATLAGILSGARRSNCRDHITGALLCRHDLYLQLIEGPVPAIDALYGRIAADDRHDDVVLLRDAEVGERMFPDWAMLDDQAPSLLGTATDARGEGAEAASTADLLAIFARLSAGAASRAGLS